MISENSWVRVRVRVSVTRRSVVITVKPPVSVCGSEDRAYETFKTSFSRFTMQPNLTRQPFLGLKSEVRSAEQEPSEPPSLDLRDIYSQCGKKKKKILKQPLNTGHTVSTA